MLKRPEPEQQHDMNVRIFRIVELFGHCYIYDIIQDDNIGIIHAICKNAGQ